MATCLLCNQEMTTALSCTLDALHQNGVRVELLRWGFEPGGSTPAGRCGDCGVLPGGLHHLGCDMQRCPACERQLLSCGCVFDAEGDFDDDEDEYEIVDTWIDENGCFTEKRRSNGQDVIIHYDDVPDSDITTVDGIPCTTALRTVIDMASSVAARELDEMVRDALARGLFTLAEANDRLAEDDMATRPGAERLRRLLAR